MASGNFYSAEKVDVLVAGAVVGAAITAGHLILQLRDGTTVDAGAITGSVADASDTVKGAVELATDVETIAGTDSARAVTPLGLAALTATATRSGLVELATTGEATTGTDTVRAVTPAGLKTVADTKQPLDSDLTAIAALTGTNDNVIQRKAGAWTERTMAQLATDLAVTGEFSEKRIISAGVYVDTDGAFDYVGATDPASLGTVINGSVWYQIP